MIFVAARTRCALSTPFCKQTTVASGLTNGAICAAVAEVAFAFTQNRISEQSRTALISVVAMPSMRCWPSDLSRTRPFVFTASTKCFRPMKTTGAPERIKVPPKYPPTAPAPTIAIRGQSRTSLIRYSLWFEFAQTIGRIRPGFVAPGDNRVDDTGEFLCLPMSSRLPPLLDAWIGNHVTHRSLNFTPQRSTEYAVTMREIHCLEIFEEAIEKRAKPQLRHCIKIVEALHPAKI